MLTLRITTTTMTAAHLSRDLCQNGFNDKRWHYLHIVMMTGVAETVLSV